MEPLESDSQRAFKLFLELLSPAEFLHLLTARVEHLLKIWPPEGSAAQIMNMNGSGESTSTAAAMNYDSIRSFLIFFKIDDASALSFKTLWTAPIKRLHDHLLALQTSLTIASPQEIQDIIEIRLSDIVRNRDTIIQGVLDVMRSTSEVPARDGKSTGEDIDVVNNGISNNNQIPSDSESTTKRSACTIDSKAEQKHMNTSARKRRRIASSKEDMAQPIIEHHAGVKTRSYTARHSKATPQRRSHRISARDSGADARDSPRIRRSKSSDKLKAQPRVKALVDKNIPESEDNSKKSATRNRKSYAGDCETKSSSNPHICQPTFNSEPESKDDNLFVNYPQSQVTLAVQTSEISTRMTRSKLAVIHSSSSHSPDKPQIDAKRISSSIVRRKSRSIALRRSGSRHRNQEEKQFPIEGNTNMQRTAIDDAIEKTSIIEGLAPPPSRCNQTGISSRQMNVDIAPRSPDSGEPPSPPGPVLRAVNWSNGHDSPSAMAEIEDIDGQEGADDASLDMSNPHEGLGIQLLPSSSPLTQATYKNTEATNEEPEAISDDPGTAQTMHTIDSKTSTLDPASDELSPALPQPRISSGRSTPTASPRSLPPPAAPHLGSLRASSVPSSISSSNEPDLSTPLPLQQKDYPYLQRSTPLRPVPAPVPDQQMSHFSDETRHIHPLGNMYHPSFSPHYPSPYTAHGPSPPSSVYSPGSWVGAMVYVPYRVPPPPGPSSSQYGPPHHGFSPHPSQNNSPHPPPHLSSHQHGLYLQQPYSFQQSHYQFEHPQFQPVQTDMYRQYHQISVQSTSNVDSQPAEANSSHKMEAPSARAHPAAPPYPYHYKSNAVPDYPLSFQSRFATSASHVPFPLTRILPRPPSPHVKPPEAPKRNAPPKVEKTPEPPPPPPPVNVEVTYTDDAAVKESCTVRRKCHNCTTIDAPSWRKSKITSGKILCNKCGIYESTHHVARPLRTRPRRTYAGDTGKRKKSYKKEKLGMSEDVLELIRKGKPFQFVIRH